MIYFADFTRIMLMSKEILHCVNYALVGGEREKEWWYVWAMKYDGTRQVESA